MSAWEDFNNTVKDQADYYFQKGLGLLNQGLEATRPSSMFGIASEVAEQNTKQIQDALGALTDSSVGKGVGKFGQMMQETGADYALPTIGAMWKPTKDILRKAVDNFTMQAGGIKNIHPMDLKELSDFLTGSSKTHQALRYLSEEIPAVQRTPLELGHGAMGGTYLPPQRVVPIKNFLSSNRPIDYESMSISPLWTEDFIGKYSPITQYAHEAGHSILGGLETTEFPFPQHALRGLVTPYEAVHEGFADAFGNTLMGRYNKSIVPTYWSDPYFKYSLASPLYIRAGEIGRTAGESIRNSQMFDNQTVLESLLKLLRGD